MIGLVHAAAATASRLHVNVDPLIVEWNANVALVVRTEAAGALSMIVSGAGPARTTLHEDVAAVGSATPPAVATTLKACAPVVRPA